MSVAGKSGCALPEVLKKIQLKTFAADGTLAGTRNLTDVEAPGGIAKDIDLGDIPRDRRIEAEVLVQTGTPSRTYVLRGTTKTLLRPDLVVEEITPRQALAGRPVVISVVIGERNGDVGATAVVSMSAIPGATKPVVVPPGGHVTVNFAAVTFATAVPVELTVTVNGADPTETDVANNTRSATLDVTEHQLPTPRNVLFPSLLGYGAQFGMHLYAPITPWPPDAGYGDVENKVKALEPQLVRIFYNDNWDGNANGKFPDWQVNYASFVRVVQLAQEAGATIDISFQNLGNVTKTETAEPAMTKFADVLEELVRRYGLTNVRWAEVGNEPNSGGGITLAQYNVLYRALNAQLVARGLRDQIHLMGGGLVESGAAGNHRTWLKYIAENMGDIVDAYAEHIYWWYDVPGRLEYRLRDTYNLMTKELPAGQQKPEYMMEFGIRGYNTCAGKPPLPVGDHLYYRDASCTDIWRTNIAGFQQLWFNIDSAQLGVAGTSKWDAYWSMYDRSSPNNQLYWMVGPPTEGSPLTPTYHAMSLLFHVTAPGWQIIGVEPWESNDWTVPAYGVIGGNTSDDTPEKELVGYAGPNGELTIVGLDTRGRDLNTASTNPPSAYSIGGLPPNTSFNLALWNATGDGTNSVAGTVTTNAAGVARFEVPLQAGFALTTVPVS
ncbi:MAG TPA: hypothetical protein VEL10_06020 [Gaiellaceae bacterium]|nr:hypothetical protein [Gaiellaceae bacterium]